MAGNKLPSQSNHMNYSDTSPFESKLAPGVKFVLRKMSHGRRVKLNKAIAPMVAKGRDINQQLAPINEEIQRAEDAAKIEPCSCKHPVTTDYPVVAKWLGDIARANESIEDEDAKIELLEVCHAAASKRCIVPGCDCRRAKPENNAYAERERLLTEDRAVVDDEIHPAYLHWGVKEISGMTINDEPATVDSLLADGPEGLVNEIVVELQRLIRLSPEEQLAFNTPTTSGAPVAGPIPIMSAPTVGETNSTASVTVAA